jgi:nucleotide-binding universal stress UspA family protein
MGRFILGSVADKVLHQTKTPLLLYRPIQEAYPAMPMTIVILPLDGSPLSEKALPTVRELASALKLRVLLVRVRQTVPTYGTNLGGVEWYEPRMEEEHERMVAEYLTMHQIEMKKAGLEVATQVLAGSPSLAILDLVRDTPSALVVMTTRGRSGTGRAVLGSVADRVARHANAPVLLIRP